MRAGSLIRELGHLPGFWRKVNQNDLPEITIQKIRYGKSRRQYSLFLKPVKPIKKIIIYFHGGGWTFGKPDQFIRYSAPLLKNDCAVFLPAIRRLPFADFKKMRRDLTGCTRSIFEFLKKERLDGIPVICGGMSSGGHFAAHIFYDINELRKAGFKQHPFSGLMLFGAPLDLTKMPKSPVLRQLTGNFNEELFNYSNPVNLLSDEIQKPVFGVHGTKDGLVPFDCSRVFFDNLKTFQVEKIEFLVLKNRTHLDAVAWTHFNGDLRRQILDWLNRIS